MKDGNGNPACIQFRPVLGLNWVLECGDEDGGANPTSGFTASAYVRVPAGGEGELAFVQLVKSRRTLTHADGTVLEVVNTGVDYQADAPIPYGSVTFPATVLGTAGASDLPQTRNIQDSDLSADVNDDFTLYLMYRPTGAGNIWVTLNRTDWGWTAAVKRSATTAWAVDVFDPNVPPPSMRGPTSITTSELPEWQKAATTK